MGRREKDRLITRVPLSSLQLISRDLLISSKYLHPALELLLESDVLTARQRPPTPRPAFLSLPE